MIFSRSKTDFTTRLSINDNQLDRISVTKLLGLCISEDLSWEQNTKNICRKAYSRISILTKLKYVGVSTEDLLDIYVLFIRSTTEYCAVAFHSSLTVEQTTDIERIQKTCLKIILNDSYTSYSDALRITGLDTLQDRREKRCLSFARKCLAHPVNKRLFPRNKNTNKNDNIRCREKFTVNFARTAAYEKSTIPYCQRLLNSYFSSL